MSVVFDHFARVERVRMDAHKARSTSTSALAGRTPAFTPAEKLEARARHTRALNGFGFAAVVHADTRSLERAARVHRARLLGHVVADAAKWLGGRVRSAVLAWRQHSHARAVYAALNALDAGTLRDLGFARSELASVAAEASGLSERTRIRVVHTGSTRQH